MWQYYAFLFHRCVSTKFSSFYLHDQSDLNKENQKPICKSDKFAEADSHKSSLDELEEGEIISDNEKPEPQRSFDKSAKPRASTEVQNTKTSPESRKSSMRLDKDSRKISSMKMHQTKSKWNRRRSESSRSSKTEKKEVNEYFKPGKNSSNHSHTLFCPRDYAYVTNDKKTCKEKLHEIQR